MLKKIENFLIRLLDILKKEKESYIKPVIEVKKEEQKVVDVIRSKAWCGGLLEDRKKMFALAKRICKEEKLSEQMTKDLLATIYGESGFNQWCVNESSKDYGICQFSIKYYLVEYKMTINEALADPEKCIRIMCKNFKVGRQSNWVAYQYRAKYYQKMLELDER